MRTYVPSPAAPGRYPGLLLFSEILQVTGPIRRTVAFLAGHGYTVAVPEIFHELEDGPGVVLAYDADAAPSLTFSPTTPPAPASSGRSGSVSAAIFPSVQPSIPMSGPPPASTPPISTSAVSARV
jgi:carboxymethylenebutenolidase